MDSESKTQRRPCYRKNGKGDFDVNIQNNCKFFD